MVAVLLTTMCSQRAGWIRAAAAWLEQTSQVGVVFFCTGPVSASDLAGTFETKRERSHCQIKRFKRDETELRALPEFDF